MPAVKRRFALVAAAFLTLACGARTGLHEPPPDAGPVSDAAPDVSDAAPDVSDAAPDVSDAAPDVFDAAPDVHHTSCEEAGYAFTGARRARIPPGIASGAAVRAQQRQIGLKRGEGA